ncbi:MAG: alpha/beta fold hydrolase, partial [Myxococcota bacterium]
MTRTANTETFTHGGETFLLRGWPSPVRTDTVIVVHHGLGEHGGRYASLVRHLETLPAHIWSFDLRGHGETTGRRGDAAGIDELAGDFEAILPVIVQRSGASRVIVIGHSLGAVIVAWYLTTRTPHPAIVAVALSAPPVRVARTPNVRVKAAFGRVLRRVAPRMTLPSGLPPAGISSDPAEVDRYTSDPLIHDRLSVRLGLSLLEDAPKILERASKITLPILLWHGVDDPIVDIEGTRDL